MKLHDQVASLDLCKRLKELNVKQDSYAYWIEDIESHEQPCVILRVGYTPEIEEQYSAFTVAELGEMLPTKFYWEDSSECVYLRIVKYTENYHISYFDHDDKWFDWYVVEDINEANARAKMLIHLIENNLLTLKETTNDA